MWPMYIAMAVVMILMALYLYVFIKRICETFGAATHKKGVKIGIIIAAICLMVLGTVVFDIGLMVILHVMVAAWCMQLVNFIIKKLARDRYKDSFHLWKKIYGSGIIPIVVTTVLMVYGYINMHNVVETDYTVYTHKEIREEGYRIALVADVHFGVSLDLDELKEKCQEINDKDVDIVILCGDIVDENTSKEDMKAVFKALSAIESTYGTFYVYGNHDRQLYRTDREYTEEELANTIKENGITILQDETYAINDEFVIAGREDNSYKVVKERMALDELLENVDKTSFILTLDHQPKEYEENGQAGTDLLLSGHTHGGQIWPAQFLFEIAKFDDAVYGLTQIDDDTQAIVTSGFAGWGYPIKTAAPAEYVIIDIKNNK